MRWSFTVAESMHITLSCLSVSSSADSLALLLLAGLGRTISTNTFSFLRMRSTLKAHGMQLVGLSNFSFSEKRSSRLSFWLSINQQSTQSVFTVLGDSSPENVRIQFTRTWAETNQWQKRGPGAALIPMQMHILLNKMCDTSPRAEWAGRNISNYIFFQVSHRLLKQFLGLARPSIIDKWKSEFNQLAMNFAWYY